MALITGLVLAGGQARRMGGIDKGLLDLGGRTMIAHVIERLAPQVEGIVINANQNVDRYAAFGYPVVSDVFGGFAGPLAGLQAGLRAMQTPLMVTAPCDSPFLPMDLVARLHDALERAGGRIAIARTADGLHPVFSLMRREVIDDLEEFLAAGGRKVDAWTARLAPIEVTFDDELAAFANINTPEELSAFQGAATK